MLVIVGVGPEEVKVTRAVILQAVARLVAENVVVSDLDRNVLVGDEVGARTKVEQAQCPPDGDDGRKREKDKERPVSSGEGL